MRFQTVLLVLMVLVGCQKSNERRLGFVQTLHLNGMNSISVTYETYRHVVTITDDGESVRLTTKLTEFPSDDSAVTFLRVEVLRLTDGEQDSLGETGFFFQFFRDHGLKFEPMKISERGNPVMSVRLGKSSGIMTETTIIASM